MSSNTANIGIGEYFSMPTLDQLAESQDIQLQLTPTQSGHNDSNKSDHDQVESLFDISGYEAPSHINTIGINGIDTYRGNPVSVKVPNRDNKLRHIYLNNTEKKPAKFIGYAHPLKLSAELERLLGKNIKLCKPTQMGNLLLEVTTFQQVKQVFGITKLMNIPVSAVFATDIGTVKGYVHAPMLMDMEIEELEELWKENKVVKVDRKVVKGEERQNASLIITFKDTKIPHCLPIAGNWVTVKKFRKKLLQCQKCNKMYHIAKCCTGNYYCANCGRQHPGACKSSIKGCSNCKVEGHGATDPQCPKIKREYEIASIRDQHKVGYAKATIIYNKQNRLVPGENQGNHAAQGSNTGNKSRKIVKRKQCNATTASAISGTCPNIIANSKVGGSWTDEEGEGNVKPIIKSSKKQMKKGKTRVKPNPSPQVPPQPPLTIGEKTYAMAVSPKAKINNSQTAGPSWEEVPKVYSNGNQKTKEKVNEQTFPVHNNRFGVLSANDCESESEDEDNTIPYTKSSTPQRKKRRLIHSPKSQGQSKNIGNKKRKKEEKVVTDPIKETKTPNYKQKEKEKSKNQQTKHTKSDTTEETPERVDFENVVHIIQEVGKKATSSGNFTYIVKLLEALLKSLTKNEVDETNMSSSGPNEQHP